MKNLLRILMFVLIIMAVFFAGDFLLNQNENYDVKEPTDIEDTIEPEISGDEISLESAESGEVLVSGDTEVSGEILKNDDATEVIESGDNNVSGEGFEIEVAA